MSYAQVVPKPPSAKKIATYPLFLISQLPIPLNKIIDQYSAPTVYR